MAQPDCLTITVLGSGTSVGVPTIGCRCRVCTSSDPRDNRLRPSVLLSYGGRNVIIDTTPDFRTQVLRAGVRRLDAVLFTHAHADHIMGLDDVRPYNFQQRCTMPVYGSAATIRTLKRVYEYVFAEYPHESSVPRLELRPIDGSPFEVFGQEFLPIPLKHGSGDVYGFRFGNAAYLTDHSDIPEASLELLHGLDVLFLDALRHKPHPTHTTVGRALEYVRELQPGRAFFTHICHDLMHEETQRTLPPGVFLSYDGLIIDVDQRAGGDPGAEPDLAAEPGQAGARFSVPSRASAHDPPPRAADAVSPQRVRVYRGLDELDHEFGPCALTIGNFDGVHTGHRHILRRVREVAFERSLKASAVTFHPHPLRLVGPERAPRLLTTPEQRAGLMAEEGIQQVLVLPFTEELMQMSPETFARDIVAGRLEAKAVLVGDNFRFGYRHSGDVAMLAEYGRAFGFEVEVIHAIRMRGRTVSSSEIRNLAAEGAVAFAGRLLGRPFSLEGEVVRGRGVGTKQTVPTLNLAAETEVLPAVGVYATRTTDLADGRVWPSVTNVGYRPTFGDVPGLTVETFLIEPLEGDTPERIRVEFLLHLREERQFESPAALKIQILRDVERARKCYRLLMPRF